MGLPRTRFLMMGVSLVLAACGPSPTSIPASAVVATSAPATTTSAPDPTSALTPTAEASPSLLFQIEPAGSEARFIIDEVLGGNPNTVVGATDQVGGEIQIELGAPVQAVVGPIRVQVDGLATDSSFRDRAIRTFILETSSFPEVVFSPTSTAGLPEAPVVGQPFSFTITGDLTIRDITRPVTFSVTVTPESQDRLTGTASATIDRADYQLTIPSVPRVAGVSEQVTLELDFTAARVP
jgi:polyisoprenoid-binding protein YceI